MEKTKKQVISSFHRPVCPECECEMRPEKNGVGVLDMAGFGPCEIWDADLWKCPKCDKQVIGGFGDSAISAHYKEDFEREIKRYKNAIQLFKNYG